MSSKEKLHLIKKCFVALNRIDVKMETNIDLKDKRELNLQNDKIGNNSSDNQKHQELVGKLIPLEIFKKEIKTECLDSLRSEDQKQESKVSSEPIPSTSLPSNTLNVSTSYGPKRQTISRRRSYYRNPFKCDYPECGQTFKTLKRYEEHRMMRSNGNHFFCEVNNCFKTFDQKSQLLAHESTHQKFVCHWLQCNQKYPTKGQLIGHTKHF